MEGREGDHESGLNQIPLENARKTSADIWDKTVTRRTEKLRRPPATHRPSPTGGLAAAAALSRLYAASRGIEHVFVAGREVLGHGEVTDERPGTVLRSGRDTDTVSLAEVAR